MSTREPGPEEKKQRIDSSAAAPFQADGVTPGYDAAEFAVYDQLKASSNATCRMPGYDLPEFNAPAPTLNESKSDGAQATAKHVNVVSNPAAKSALKSGASPVTDPPLPAPLIALLGQENLDTDWNEDFQSLYDMAAFTPHEVAAANKKKTELFARFVSFSRQVAMLLVEQLERPPNEWQIQPISGAGWAGGEKFRVGKLFCKFARDDKRLYGGRDELAVKMAKNEIRCGNALLQLRVPSLHLSMMVCHRIHGHAVITTALMPLSDSSLVYGSKDAARIVLNSNDQMNELMDRVGAQLNLLPHAITNHPADKLMAVAVDCEGHISAEDGRLYLLDLGRLLPSNNPVFPFNLLHQFRPEYMRSRAANGLPALSSDAFSRFGLSKDNEAVVQAIKHYYEEHIPASAARLIDSYGKQDEKQRSTSADLITKLHSDGVNVRHMGRIRNELLKQADLLTVSPTRTSAVAALLRSSLEEMLYRTIKCLLLDKLRRSESAASALEPLSLLSAEDTNLDSIKQALAIKFDAVTLTAADVTYVQAVCNALSSPPSSQSDPAAVFANALRVRLTQACSVPDTDVVASPDFPSVEQAERLLLDELAVRERTVGALNPVLLPTMQQLLRLYGTWHETSPADTLHKADALISRMISIVDTDEVRLGFVLHNCGVFWADVGQFDRAMPLYQRSLQIDERELGSNHPEVATSLASLASLHRSAGQYEEAEALYLRALKIREEAVGPRSEDVASTLHNLGNLYKIQNRLSDAQPLFERSLAIREEVLGPDHPDVAMCLTSLANVHVRQQRFDLAEQLLVRSLQLAEQALGPTHPQVAHAMTSLGVLYQQHERHADAGAMFEKALSLRESILASEHPDIAIALNNLATHHVVDGRLNQAEPLYVRALGIRQKLYGQAGHPEVAASLSALATLYLAQERWELAEHGYRQALVATEAAFGPDDPQTAAAHFNLGNVHAQQGRFEESAKCYEAAEKILIELYTEEHPHLQQVQEYLRQARSRVPNADVAREAAGPNAPSAKRKPAKCILQ